MSARAAATGIGAIFSGASTKLRAAMRSPAVSASVPSRSKTRVTGSCISRVPKIGGGRLKARAEAHRGDFLGKAPGARLHRDRAERRLAHGRLEAAARQLGRKA